MLNQQATPSFYVSSAIGTSSLPRDLLRSSAENSHEFSLPRGGAYPQCSLNSMLDTMQSAQRPSQSPGNALIEAMQASCASKQPSIQLPQATCASKQPSIQLPSQLWPKDAQQFDLYEENVPVMDQLHVYGELWTLRVEAVPEEKGWKLQPFNTGNAKPTRASLQPWMQAQDETFAIRLNIVNLDGYCPICDSRPLSSFFRKDSGNINSGFWHDHLRSMKDCLGHKIVLKYFMLSYIYFHKFLLKIFFLNFCQKFIFVCSKYIVKRVAGDYLPLMRPFELYSISNQSTPKPKYRTREESPKMTVFVPPYPWDKYTRNIPPSAPISAHMLNQVSPPPVINRNVPPPVANPHAPPPLVSPHAPPPIHNPHVPLPAVKSPATRRVWIPHPPPPVWDESASNTTEVTPAVATSVPQQFSNNGNNNNAQPMRLSPPRQHNSGHKDTNRTDVVDHAKTANTNTHAKSNSNIVASVVHQARHFSAKPNPIQVEKYNFGNINLYL